MHAKKLDGRTMGYPSGDAKPGGRAGKARSGGDLVTPGSKGIVDRKPGGNSKWMAREQIVTGGAASSARGSKPSKSNPKVRTSGFNHAKVK